MGTVVRRVDRFPALVRDIARLRDAGTEAAADSLVLKAQGALGQDGDQLSAAEKNYLRAFVQDPYSRLPKTKFERDVDFSLGSSAGGRTASGKRERPSNGLGQPPKPSSISVQSPRQREVQINRQLPAKSPDAPQSPNGLEGLLEEVDRAQVSPDWDFRREVVRKVSEFLLQLSPHQPDVDGLRKLRAFRDRPFAGPHWDGPRHSEADFSGHRARPESPDRSDTQVRRGAGRDQASFSKGAARGIRASAPELPLTKSQAVESRAERAASTPHASQGNLAHRVPTPGEIASKVGKFQQGMLGKPSPRGEGSLQASVFEAGADDSFTSFFTFELEALSGVRGALTQWLAEKDIDVSLAEAGSFTSDENRYADTLVASSEESRFLRLRMAEQNSSRDQRYHTEIILGEEQEEGWLHAHVWSDGEGEVGTPRFIKSLFERDGVLAESSLARLRYDELDSQSDAEELFNYLRSGSRQLPVFVAGTDRTSGADSPASDFRRKARTWSKHTAGLARFALLGPEATARLEQLLGPELAPQRWSVRTYEPAMVLDDPSDARRHRFIGRESLSQWPTRKVQRRFQRTARALARRRPTPHQVRRAQHVLTQEENVALLESTATAQKNVRDHVAELTLLGDLSHDISQEELRNVSTLKMLLDGESFTEDHVERIAAHFEIAETFEQVKDQLIRRLDEQSEHIEILQLELEEKQGDVDRAVHQRNSIEVEQEILRQQRQWLQKRAIQR